MLDDEHLDDDDPEDADLDDFDQNLGPHIKQQQQEPRGLSSRALQRALMSLADERVMPSRSAIAAGEVVRVLLEQLLFKKLLLGQRTTADSIAQALLKHAICFILRM